MARNERRIIGFTVAILILALAIVLLGGGYRHDESARRELQRQADANSARVGQLESQLRDHGIEPVPPPTTAPVRRARTTSTTAVHVPTTTTTARHTTTTTTTFFPPTTTTTTRPTQSSTTSTTAPPSSTTTTAPTCPTLPPPIGRCLP